WPALVVFILLPPLLFPQAAAAADSRPLVLQSLSADEGVVEGPLAGASWSSVEVPAGLPMPLWSIKATQASVVVERRQNDAVVAGVPLNEPKERPAEPRALPGLEARFADVSTDSRVLALPLPGG